MDDMYEKCTQLDDVILFPAIQAVYAEVSWPSDPHRYATHIHKHGVIMSLNSWVHLFYIDALGHLDRLLTAGHHQPGHEHWLSKNR